MFNKIIQEDIKSIVSHNLPWDKLNNSTILISGANSFLASYILETLFYLNDKCNKKIDIIALTRNKEKTLKKYDHHKNRDDLEFIYEDVCKPLIIKKNINYIIHAASKASPKYYDVDPVGTLSANTIGTINLLRLAKKEHFKGFLFLSTGGVYGRVEDNNIPTKEGDYGYIDPIDVRSCYNESKRMGENICVSWFHQYGIPIKIVRIYYVYGPGMDLNDGRVFPTFISNIVNNKDILIKSDGSATRSFCYIGDATTAFFTVLLKGRDGEAYNVGIDKEISIYELANTLVRLFPKKDIKIIRKNEKPIGDIRNSIQRSCPDISKIRSLGWNPFYDLNEGSKRTLLSYEKQIPS